MKKNLLSLVVDIAELRSLCEDFSRLTGFATALLDLEGNVLVATGWQEACTRFHRVSEGTALKCLESDTILADRLARGEEYCLYRCGNGLMDVAVPIVIDGTQVGRLYSGQFLLEPPDMDFFRRQAAEYGFDEASYLDAVRQVPVVSEERVRQVMGFLCRLAQIIVRMGMTNRKIDDASLIVKKSPAVLFRWQTDAGWPIEFVSENVIQFGYTPEELISREAPYASMVHPEDRESFVSQVEEHPGGEEERFQREYRLVTKGGDIRWVSEHTVGERDRQGRLINYRGIVIDISERKQAEEVLRESERRYRLIVETADEGIWQVDREWRTTYVNRRMERMLGCEAGAMLGLHFIDFMDEAERGATQELMSRRERGTRETHDFRFRSRDGSILDTLVSANPLFDEGGEFCGAIAMVTDITERKRAEDALKLSQSIIDKASLGIFRGEEDARILFANEYGARMLGYTQEELCSMSFFDIDPGLTREIWREHREKLTSTGSNTLERVHRRKDGTLFPVEVTVNYFTYGGQVFSCSFSQDITKRKEAEEALRKSEEKFRIVTETSAAAVILYQGERIVYANPATARMFGYSERELLEMRFWEYVHPEFQEAVRSRGLARQRGEQVPDQYEIKVVVKGGEERWAVVSAGRIEYKGEAACIVTMIDITESKRWEGLISASLAEKELLLKEVHHRVKNNLQIISTLLDLQSESIVDEAALGSFRESQDRIKAMALIHERLYESENFASVDFAEYIENLSSYLFDSYLVDPGRIALKVDAGGVCIGIDRAIPCGLIINELLSNSLKYAFPDRRSGEITIHFEKRENGWIKLTVADTGIGLPPGLDFTRTETLGLQLVNMLVKQLRGRVRMSRDHGTAWEITFGVTGQERDA